MILSDLKYYIGEQEVSKIFFRGLENFTLVPLPPLTWDIGLQTTSTNQTFSVIIDVATAPNITVNWGDGVTQTFTTIGTKTKTYAAAGNYTVKISGSLGTSGGKLIIGQDATQRQRVKSTSVLPNIPGLTNGNSLFLDTACVTLPPGMFNFNPGITNVVNCFSGSTSLTSVPANLFTALSNCIFFFGTFGGCTSLTEVPAGLFANNLNAADFGFCFQGVTLTTTSYSNLLINMASNAASRPNNVPFHGGNSKYNTDGQTARNTLINTKSWTFTDGGLE
jgi:hypothetical protein